MSVSRLNPLRRDVILLETFLNSERLSIFKVAVFEEAIGQYLLVPASVSTT